jgi:uncharacterized membrane protein YhaH (DUF805 family)
MTDDDLETAGAAVHNELRFAVGSDSRDEVMTPLVVLPVIAIVTLVIAIGLLARDANDHRGHRRWWATLGLAATVLLVGCVAFFLSVYSQAGTT